jgi:hypothetical protein
MDATKRNILRWTSFCSETHDSTEEEALDNQESLNCVMHRFDVANATEGGEG